MNKGDKSSTPPNVFEIPEKKTVPPASRSQSNKITQSEVFIFYRTTALQEPTSTTFSIRETPRAVLCRGGADSGLHADEVLIAFFILYKNDGTFLVSGSPTFPVEAGG